MKESLGQSGPPKQAPENGLPKNDVHRLREALGDHAYPVATGKFLEKSREKYANPLWLAREIGQNFLDHNPKKGTLDGVEISEEKNSDKGITRFTVKGNWPFTDATGLITLHSDKPAGETAGGNGIGLKQTALILLRDFNVKHFEVLGEKWKVKYRLVPKSQANLSHDWLVAEQTQDTNSGECSYVIETDNSDMIKSLKELPNITVGPENKFLKEPDFKNEKGVIKWLPPREEGRQPRVGRLFINGQVMDVEDGPDSEGWRGMRGCTLELDNVAYNMSIDRPPVRKWNINTYMRQMLESISTPDLAKLIANSETIWSRTSKDDKWEVLDVIENCVNSLRWKLRFVKSGDTETPKIAAGLKTYFTEHKYLARDRKVSQDMEDRLIKDGYTLCPDFFTEIGMPSAAEKIDLQALREGQKPDPDRARSQRDYNAKEYGIELGFSDIVSVSPEDFAQVIYDRLRPFAEDIQIEGGNIHVRIKDEIPEGLLLQTMVKGDSADRKLLQAVRDIAAHGLSSEMLSYVTLSQNGKDFNFGTSSKEGDTALFIRKSDSLQREDSASLKIGTNPKFAKYFNFQSKTGEAQPTPKKTEGIFRKPRKIFTVSLAAALLSTGLNEFYLKKGSGSQGNVPTSTATGFGTKSSETTKNLNPKINEQLAKEKKTYEEWRKEHKNEIDKTKYPEAKTLEDVVRAYNKAKIAQNINGGKEKVGEFDPNPDVIEDFTIVKEPSARELKRLGLLRDITYELTGIVTQNALFIFTGRGAKGVNMHGDGIGMHQEVMKGGFLEAFGTWIHENAHNNREAHGHDETFMHTMSDLHLQIEEKLLSTLAGANNGERLSEKDSRILELVRNWEN